MTTKTVTQVVVTYVDGTTETIQTPGGFHRSINNNKSHEKDWRNTWLDHEIRWTEKP